MDITSLGFLLFLGGGGERYFIAFLKNIAGNG